MWTFTYSKDYTQPYHHPVMQISSDVIGLKNSFSQAHKYQKGLNRLFLKPCPKETKVSSIAIELKSTRGAFSSIAIELKIDGQRALRHSQLQMNCGMS